MSTQFSHEYDDFPFVAREFYFNIFRGLTFGQFAGSDLGASCFAAAVWRAYAAGAGSAARTLVMPPDRIGGAVKDRFMYNRVTADWDSSACIFSHRQVRIPTLASDNQTGFSAYSMTSPICITDVTVIVVTYNSAHCIAALAPALATLPHVVIVDNASDDDTLAKVAHYMPNATVLRNTRNLGFGAANNVALRQAKSSHALLLNPDCVPDADFMGKLIDVACQYPDAALIAPHLIRKGGNLEVSYRWPTTLWESKGPAAVGPCCVGFVCGAAMLFNLQVMREIGFFDETFFLYHEDEDLCQRIFMQGKQIILAPQVELFHLSRGSVRGLHPLRAEFIRGYHHAQSKLKFCFKYGGSRKSAQLRRRTMLLAFATLLPRLLVPRPRYLARLTGRICGLFAFKAPVESKL